VPCGIYSYRDIKNDFKVVYIGQSKDIYKRHRQHLIKSSKNTQPINRVLQSDPLRYSIQIEVECSKDELDAYERLFIKYYNPKFNFTKGGIGQYPKRKNNGKYKFWDSKKTHYISHKNQNRNRPFRLYYDGYYIGGCYFEEWFTINIIHKLIEEAIN